MKEVSQDRIGFIVWWNLAVKHHEPMLSDVREYAEDHGLTDELPEQMDERLALIRTCTGYTDDDGRCLVRPVSNDRTGRRDNVTYAVLRTSTYDSGDRFERNVDPEVIDRVAYLNDEGSGVLICERETKTGLAIIAEARRIIGCATATEIRSVVKAALLKNMRAFVLRECGGVFFVPKLHEDELRELDANLKKWGNSELIIAPLHQDASGAAASAARDHFLSQVLNLREEIKDIKSKKTHEKTILNRLDKFQELKEQSEYYAELLGMMSADILEDISSLEKQLAEML